MNEVLGYASQGVTFYLQALVQHLIFPHSPSSHGVGPGPRVLHVLASLIPIILKGRYPVMSGLQTKILGSGDYQRCSLVAVSIPYQVSFQNWPSEEFCFEATHSCFPMVRGFGDNFRFPERCTNSAETSRPHLGSFHGCVNLVSPAFTGCLCSLAIPDP